MGLFSAPPKYGAALQASAAAAAANCALASLQTAAVGDNPIIRQEQSIYVPSGANAAAQLEPPNKSLFQAAR